MYVETDRPPIPTPRISVKLTLIKTKHRTYYAMTGSHKERWPDWQFECLMITTLWWWLVHWLVLCWLNFAAELISIFYNQLHRPQLHPVLSQSTGMWKVAVLYLKFQSQNTRQKQFVDRVCALWQRYYLVSTSNEKFSRINIFVLPGLGSTDEHSLMNKTLSSNVNVQAGQSFLKCDFVSIWSDISWFMGRYLGRRIFILYYWLGFTWR